MLSDRDYFASLPTFFAGAAGFFTDPAGDALLVDELDEARFVRPDEAAGLLAPRVAPRVAAALRARSTGGTEYLTDSR